MTQDMFERELDRRAGDVRGTPFTFDDVRGRAASIRRRRRAGTVAAVAAAMALVVVVPTILAGGDRPSEDIEPAPSPTVVPTPRPDGTFALSLDAPAGAAPGVSYIYGPDRRLETTEGRVDLPSDYEQVLPYDGGWIARLGDEGAVLDADLEVVRTFRTGAGLILSDDGGRVAWSEIVDGSSTIVSATTTVPTEEAQFEVPGEVEPVGFMADGSIAFEASDFTFGIASPGGGMQAIDGVDYIEDTSPASGLLAVQTKYLDGGLGQSCSGMLSPQDGVLWEECGWKLGQVSPDGSRVIAFASPYEGPSPDRIAVLDAEDGSVVVEYSGLMIDQAVWEDGGSVLATALGPKRQAILRLGTDGTVERATEPVAGPPMSVVLSFTSYPRG